MYSIGFSLNKEGMLTEVQWDGAAFKAGLTADMTIVAINGQAYDADFLKEVIKEAKGGKEPIDLLIKNKDEFTTVHVDYHDGLRYPRFERVGKTPARLDDILATRK